MQWVIVTTPTLVIKLVTRNKDAVEKLIRFYQDANISKNARLPSSLIICLMKRC